MYFYPLAIDWSVVQCVCFLKSSNIIAEVVIFPWTMSGCLFYVTESSFMYLTVPSWFLISFVMGGSSAVVLLNRTSAVMLLNRTGGPWNLPIVHNTLCTYDLYVPVRNGFWCVHIHYLSKWERVGPRTSQVFWVPNGTRLLARCHFTGPTKLSISMPQPPPTCPGNGPARIKYITHGAI